MINNISLPYCYKITHKTTGQFYIGSRCNKQAKHYSEDFGIKYFTSSKLVKELGFENFKIDWIEEFEDPDHAYDWEQMMIYVNLKDPLCLNKSCYFGKKKWSTAGIKRINAWNIGRKLSQETKDKISIGNKCKIFSKESKLKMSESQKNRSKEINNKIAETLRGQKLSQETKDKISLSNKGRKLSLETRNKMSKSRKGKTLKKSICKYCERLFSGGNMKRWHGDNCKNKV